MFLFLLFYLILVSILHHQFQIKKIQNQHYQVMLHFQIF